MNTRTTKILIVRRSALGDTIHTLPLAAALRRKFPDAQIDWVVEDKAAHFVLKNPLLDKVYVLHKKTGGLKEFLSVISDIRKQKYDIVIDTQQLLKSAVIMGLSGGKRKIALSDGREFSGLFANEIIKTNRRQFDIHYHVLKRNLEIAQYLGADTENIEFLLPKSSDASVEKAKGLLSSCNPDKKTVIIAPETTWANKHWTVENWKKLIDYLKGRVNLVYTGTKNDNGLSDTILSEYGDDIVLNLCGKTNLEELTEVLKLADLVITPDSGTAHISWATGVPAVITLFFATSSERTAPFGDKYFSVQASTPCSPCMKKKCVLNIGNECISAVNFEEIVKLVNKVLQFD
ncbi:MAG: glycosyltransferase family 9 protein [Candidatus Gastranaerophilales bacterium]|nr:glycosyltransferase family 9 protein [Candidatus Gastranaerophilales bacterium]